MLLGRKKENLYVSSRQSNSLKSLDVQWKPHPTLAKQKSVYFDYMGELHFSKDGKMQRMDERHYCKLCYEQELAKENGTVTKIYNLSHTSGSGNFFNHAQNVHGLSFSKPQSSKLTSWLTKTTKGNPAASGYELYRDMALWCCMDLMPFDIVEKQGFRRFNEKNLHLTLPVRNTLAGTALVDIYTTIKTIVKEKLKRMVSGTLMMDGWTDRYRRRPYFGIRISTICDWKLEVFTLAVKPVGSHTSENLKNFVQDVEEEFLPMDRQPLLFDTTDGAANMVKLSNLLDHERTTCIAHSLHNLVMTDSINRVPKIQALLGKCEEIVRLLHFRTEDIQDTTMYLKEQELISKISSLEQELAEDENNPVFDDENQLAFPHDRHHLTVKNSVPTRWNSVLTMVDSLLSLQKEANEVLKRMGKHGMVFRQEDFDEMEKLKALLAPFEEFTLIVSQVAPNLSVIPLIRGRIKKLCSPTPEDSSSIKATKQLIIKNVDKRLPITKLVNIASAFDPSVRDIVLSKDEIRELLVDLHEDLMMSK